MSVSPNHKGLPHLRFPDMLFFWFFARFVTTPSDVELSRQEMDEFFCL